jgi:hypothetical protein
MKRHLLFVHGDGERAHDEDMKMVESLRDTLGSGYETRQDSASSMDAGISSKTISQRSPMIS